MKLKIGILSYYFLPENRPRSFRTFELAKEFAKLGHDVSLFIPEYNYDYNDLIQKYKFNIVHVPTGFLLNRNRKDKDLHANLGGLKKREGHIKKFKDIIRKIIYYLFGEKKIEYAFTLARALAKHKKEFDIFISISYPLSVHVGSYLAFKRNPKLAKLKIADCGDPYYYMENIKLGIHHKYFEKMIYRIFDYLTIPTENALRSYLNFVNREEIKIIPQGFDFSNILRAKYRENSIPTFGYAGAFWKKVRDPNLLFDYLIRVGDDFRFIIYTNFNETENMEIINRYSAKLEEKLILNNLVPREELIFQLSKCDFLINVENTTSNQMPSKLVDYALIKRPVYSFKPNEFDPKVFEKFLNKNYEDQLNIEIDEFNIKNVARKFLVLYK